jgi:putative hydrolase of the HAD superfamily
MTENAKDSKSLKKIADTNAWVFDLDNTLYSASSNLFLQIDKKMKAFIARAFDLQPDDAFKLQKKYYHEYGTTMRGLMINHGIDPEIFMNYVHDIDHSVLQPDPDLDNALGNLPGRKFIYTNGSARHASAVMEQLGISRHFMGIFDIRAGDYVPKPDPRSYTDFIARHSVAPQHAVMFEDSHKNLKPASDLGMTTVFVRNTSNAPAEDEDLSHCHYSTENLAAWLRNATDNIERN